MLAFDALVCEGNAATGDRWIEDSVAFGEGTNVPHYRSYANQLAAQCCATASQRERARQHAATSLAIAGEFGYVAHETAAAMVDGWARGDAAAIRHGLVRYEGAEHFAGTSLFRALLVETLLETGDLAAVPAELAAAFEFAERSGERQHLAELYRLRGEWARRQSDSLVRRCHRCVPAGARARAGAGQPSVRIPRGSCHDAEVGSAATSQPRGF
jgi:hypothetical protein